MCVCVCLFVCVCVCDSLRSDEKKIGSIWGSIDSGTVKNLLKTKIALPRAKTKNFLGDPNVTKMCSIFKEIQSTLDEVRYCSVNT